MVSQRFNLVEKLTYISNQKPSKESRVSRQRSFDHGNIPDVFRNMYYTANVLASREGVLWIQVKYAQDNIDELQKQKRPSTRSPEDEVPSPLLQTELWEYVCKRRDEFVQQMTQLLELYAKSKWASKDDQKDK